MLFFNQARVMAQQSQRNSHFAMPAYDASEIPACVDLAREPCGNTYGCEYLQADASSVPTLQAGCVPKPRAFFNTITHPTPGNDTKAVHALTTLAGQAPGPKLTNLMAQNRHWLTSDMANKLRPGGSTKHPWVPTEQNNWDRQKVVQYVGNDLQGADCAICFEDPGGSACEQMQCCGRVFHVACSNRWFEDPTHVNCPGCSSVVRAPQSRYNMTRHIPSGTIRSSSRHGCMRLTSPVVGDNSLCEIDFNFAVDLATIAHHATRYDGEFYFGAYLAELTGFVRSLGYVGEIVVFNPRDAAEQARGESLMSMALELGSAVEIKYFLTQANNYQLPAAYGEGEDDYLRGVLKFFCEEPGISVSLGEVRQMLPPADVVGLAACGVYCPVTTTVQQLAGFCRSHRKPIAFACLLSDVNTIDPLFALLKSDHGWRDLSVIERDSFPDAKPGIRSAGVDCTVVRSSDPDVGYVLCFISFEHKAFNDP